MSSTTSSNAKPTTPVEVERMREYKGPSLPAPIVPLSGVSIGLGLQKIIVRRLPIEWAAFSPQDSLLILLQATGSFSVLFFAEFLFGVDARSTTDKGSFSPAAIQADGQQPFAIVQANRIFQNHIEATMAFLPAAFAATAAGADVRQAVACTLSFVASRFLYRFCYCRDNPFWRICGVAAAHLQTFTCWYLIAKQKSR